MGTVSSMAKPLDLPFDPIARAGDIWERTWGPASAMRVATSVMRVQQILLARYDEALRPHELTFARYEALVLLQFSASGALPLKVIGRRLMVHPTSVTNAISRLAAAGLVDRQPNPRDRRGVLAAITDEGRQVAEAATKDLLAMDFGLGVLDEAARDTMFAMLRVIRAESGDFRVPPESAAASGGAGPASGGAAPGGHPTDAWCAPDESSWTT